MAGLALQFLSARWVRLAMLNYQVDPAILRSLVPAGTELDTWNDQCFVSMVGFQFRDTRVLGFSVPFHRNFLEVNLRFYVRRDVGAESRRGVVFVKEIVPRRAVTWIANGLYNEKYVTLPMTFEESPDHVLYSWQFEGKDCRLGVTASGSASLPNPETEESFITEHYWGYVKQRDDTTLEYRVEHPVWRVSRGLDPIFECDVEALYGAAFSPFISGHPSSCFLADGSEVVVRRGLRVEHVLC